METSNLKSGKLSFSEGRFALLGGGQKIFIFQGGCPIRGFNFLGGLYPLCILLYSAGKATLLRGGVTQGSGEHTFIYRGCPVKGTAYYMGGESIKLGHIVLLLAPHLLCYGKP